jgi:DNA-binding LacI/PurR family transcriptional regulator
MTQHEQLEDSSSGPKYKRIYTQLRTALESGHYLSGEKMPSENELVESYSASRPTIRRALAQLELDGLIQRRMGSGTIVAPASRRKGLFFGLLIPELGMTEIFEPICQGISQAHLDGQHELLWGPTLASGTDKSIQAEHLARYYVDRRVSGIFFAPMELFAGGDEVNLAITRALDEAQIPIILLDRDIMRFPEHSKYDVVGIDNQRAGYMLTEHILSTGAKRVAFLAIPYSAHTVDARISGYTHALFALLGHNAKPIVKWANPSDLDAMKSFLNEEHPDAIICANDYTAALLLGTLNTLEIQVPKQIRIAGFDDVKYARLLQTPLTTIHQPCQDIGAAALQAMLNRIASPQAPARDYLVDFRLTVRQSTTALAPATPNRSSHPASLSALHTAQREAGPDGSQPPQTEVS